MAPKNFNLPWHQSDRYAICFYAKRGVFSLPVKQALEQSGFAVLPEMMMAETGRDWKSTWDKAYKALHDISGLNEVDVVIASAAGDAAQQERRSTAAIQAIAESLWLGDALLEDRVVCYLQPVVSSKDKIFGYESFARVRSSDGKIIGGDKIVAASRVLNIEFMMDRHLHIQAIRTFGASEFNGYLFINFFPGFIHRPAVYLEGLSETAKSCGVFGKHIVLDFTQSETPRDLAHLKGVCEYARSCGYSLALDDIETMDVIRKLMPDIRPDFVKIDMQLARQVADIGKRQTIRQIVDLVHSTGSTVIGEGVETEEMHTSLKELGVDLFQGYFFGAPAPVEVALKRAAQ